MNGRIRTTTLVEDAARAPGLLAEHGLAIWIECGDRRILLDTGQSDIITHNARQLDVNLDLTDAIVISHGHYDHTGGLPTVCNIAPDAKVVVHPAALTAKYRLRGNGERKSIGIPESASSAVLGGARRVCFTEGPTEIAPDVFATGQIPRVTEFEDTGGRFFYDPDCTKPDLLPDDQALYLTTESGTVVLLGCAHAGVINTLLYIRELTSNRPILAVIGGMHLGSASAARMEATIRTLRQLEPSLIAPAHCTGERATSRLRAEFPEQWAECHAGTRFVFD